MSIDEFLEGGFLEAAAPGGGASDDDSEGARCSRLATAGDSGRLPE